MKKIYVSLSLLATLLFVNKVSAQSAITLSSTYLPQAGYSYSMVADTASADMPTFTVSLGSASAQSWSYLTGFNTSYGTASTFVAPAGNPGASNFPNSNLATNTGTTWGYLISGSNGLYLDGANLTTSGLTVNLDFVPNAPEIPTPFTYSNTTTVAYTATASATYQGLPIIIKHRALRTVTADAFGSITTPIATYSNTLRVYTHEITSDSIFLDLVTPTFQQAQYDTTTNYTWYQNSADAIVMSIDQNTAGKATKVEYLQTLNYAGINTVKPAGLNANLFPNPTNSLTYLNYENTSSSNVSASIFDVTGRQVAVLLNNQQQGAGKQTLTIDVNTLQLPKGLYMVQLSGNGITKTLKLNVQ